MLHVYNTSCRICYYVIVYSVDCIVVVVDVVAEVFVTGFVADDIVAVIGVGVVIGIDVVVVVNAGVGVDTDSYVGSDCVVFIDVVHIDVSCVVMYVVDSCDNAIVVFAVVGVDIAVVVDVMSAVDVGVDDENVVGCVVNVAVYVENRPHQLQQR